MLMNTISLDKIIEVKREMVFLQMGVVISDLIRKIRRQVNAYMYPLWLMG